MAWSTFAPVSGSTWRITRSWPAVCGCLPARLERATSRPCRARRRMWIWGREEAIATGIFGPRVTERARERIGDVVAAAYARVGIAQRDVDPAQARLNGHHGSLTPAEQLVPLLRYRT